MRGIRSPLLLVLALLAVGCTSPIERFRTYYWAWPPGYTDKDYAYHDKACHEAVKPYPECMRELGYREITREEFEATRGRKPG